MRALLSAVLLLCLTLPSATAVSAQAPQRSAVAHSSAAAPLIGGERFVRRVINDPKQGGMAAITLHLPETWRLQGKVEWNYAWTETPVALSCEADNPANAEAYFCYSTLRFDSMQVAPNLRQYVKNQQRPGERMATGAISLDPKPPAQIMAMFVQRLRGKEPNFKLIGKEDLPNLGKALGLEPWPGQQGIAVKVSYDLNGKPVEEAFYGLYYLSRSGNITAPGSGGAGVTQTNWGLRALQSFRAPAGTLDKRMTVFAAIATSVHPTPEWGERAKAVDAQLVQIFNQKVKQGYDQIQASHAMAEQVMANEQQFDKGVDSWMQSQRASAASSGAGGSGSSGTGGRSVWDKFDDNTRGVDTVNDPTMGTSQHSNLEQYHWTDGFGNYYDTNDPNYNPGNDRPGNWTQMSPAG